MPPSSQRPTIEAIHAALVSLDAPPISLQDLQELNKGAFADTLTSVTTQLLGREGVAKARAQIHAASKTGLKPKSGTLQADLNKATSRLRSAKKAVETYEKELDEKMEALCSVQEEEKQLLDELARKQRVEMMLGVLKNMEEIRIKRFESLRKMIKQTADSVMKTDKCPDSVTILNNGNLPSQILISPSDTSHTQDALLELHADHIRFSKTPPDISSTMNLLEEHLGSKAKAQECLDIVRQRASRRQSDKQSRALAVPNAELDRLSDEAADKSKHLQTLSDKAVALDYLCRFLLKSLSTFRGTTTPALIQSIEEEANKARGYIETSMNDIITHGQPDPPNQDAQFLEDVKNACKIRGNVTSESVAEYVEEKTRHVNELDRFLTSTRLDPLDEHSPSRDSLIDNYLENSSAFELKAKELIRRKLAKVEAGETKIAKEVEETVTAMRKVVGI